MVKCKFARNRFQLLSAAFCLFPEWTLKKISFFDIFFKNRLENHPFWFIVIPEEFKRQTKNGFCCQEGPEQKVRYFFVASVTHRGVNMQIRRKSGRACEHPVFRHTAVLQSDCRFRPSHKKSPKIQKSMILPKNMRNFSHTFYEKSRYYIFC